MQSAPRRSSDRETIARFHEEFIGAGLSLRFTSLGRPPRWYYPTFRELLLERDVDGAPSIESAALELEAWLVDHDLPHERVTAVTCGDWDLLRMWPKQVGHAPGLRTPHCFRTWCNVKRVFERTTGRRAPGMMGMLRALELPHVGHHHRGRDDVRNIAAIVLRLLELDASFAPTFRGSRLSGPPLDASRLTGMGLMIYDGLDGAFEIRLAEIAAY